VSLSISFKNTVIFKLLNSAKFVIFKINFSFQKEKENPVAKENEKNADNSMDEDSGSGSDAMESETAPSEEVNA